MYPLGGVFMKIRNKLLSILLIMIICFSSELKVYSYSNNIVFNLDNKNKYTILVDLNDCRLFLINSSNNKILKTYTIAGGTYFTPSPVGTWKIVSKDTWDEGFGTRWMGINVPWGKYGIHGTNKPESIGGLTSHGCIRMYNKDVEELYSRVPCGTIVIIYGGPYDMLSNNFRTLIPGNRGSDVYEVQRRLRDIGYYSGNIDGIYGEVMKGDILRLRKDNRLPLSTTIDSSIYKLLNIKPFE